VHLSLNPTAHTDLTTATATKETGGRRATATCLPPPKKIRKIFLGKNHVKFGHFVNFSCIYFRAKMSCPAPKLTELLRLWKRYCDARNKVGLSDTVHKANTRTTTDSAALREGWRSGTLGVCPAACIATQRCFKCCLRRASRLGGRAGSLGGKVDEIGGPARGRVDQRSGELGTR